MGLLLCLPCGLLCLVCVRFVWFCGVCYRVGCIWGKCLVEFGGVCLCVGFAVF